MSWRKLFDSRIVYDLSVDAGRPARYYLLAAVSLVRWSIITGTAGQSKPDTIHTYNPNWHPWDMPRPKGFSCIPSRRFPGYVYASKYNATIGVSSDPGTTIRHIYQSHGDVLLWTDTGIYCFRDDRWQHLRTPEGAPLLVEGPRELRRSTPVNV